MTSDDPHPATVATAARSGNSQDAPISRPRRFVRLWPLALLLISGVTGVAAYGAARDQTRYPYSYDSVKYIDASRHILRGEGFRATPSPFAPPAVRAEIPRLWPPGHPLLIALGSVGHLDATVSALWISRLSTGALIVPLLVLLTPMLGRTGALLVTALSLSAPGMLEWGTMAL